MLKIPRKVKEFISDLKYISKNIKYDWIKIGLIDIKIQKHINENYIFNEDTREYVKKENKGGIDVIDFVINNHDKL